MEGNLQAFLDHLASLEEGDGVENGFSKEFNSIKRHLASINEQPDLSTEAGRARGNVKKNRYKDILPFDQSRVPLTLLLNEGYSDYINANFIRGIDGERYYIATQGPLPQTVVDFWRMIWEFNVKVVVMACREFELGKKKCERYWATDEETTVVFGPFTVTHVAVESLHDEVIIRTLSVTMLDAAEARVVHQFQYTAWPDHGIPQNLDNLLEMMELVHQRQGGLRVPICVHCSAGCGRTGVICTVDYVRSLLERKLIGGGFSILDMVREMRRQRPAAVQTKDQYEFIYRIVAQMFQEVLENSNQNYENWSKDLWPSLGPSVRQIPPLTSPKPPPTSPKPPSKPTAPALGPRPLSTEPMPKDAAACETYAVVARPKSGVGLGQKPPAPSSQAGCKYENLAQGATPIRETSLYSTVMVKEAPRIAAGTTHARLAHADPSPKGQEAHGSGTVLAYTTIEFGQPGSNSRGSATCDAVDTESWAPSLPARTADSYIVQNDDEAGASSSSDNQRASKLLNILKMGFPGNSVTKDTADDGYEDVSELSTVPLSGAPVSNGIGFNTRVSKPKGPRPPPESWAVYGQ